MKAVPVVALIVFALSSRAGDKFEIHRTSANVVVKNPDGMDVVGYQLARPAESKLSVDSACYFHPVATPKGVVISDVAPPDHLHHRGVFLAWVEMHGKQDADFWGWGEHAPKKGRTIVNREITGLESNETGAGFRGRNEWLADMNPVLSEQLQAGVRTEGPATVLDVTYRLTAKDDVTLSRWAFSGFCLRVRKDGKLEAEGPDGPVKLPNPKHTEPASDWPAAPWYAYNLTLPDGTVAGAAVIDHPKNPPSLWHNHRDVRMLNPCIVALAAVQMKAGIPLVLRYRVLVYDGAAPRELLNSLAMKWEG
ncbi:MAG: PmoA family protein [Verrucomicrobia subdivision 3 bacterium]|nr:PmoA family protein [Limisphaerales bacterium]